jgi:DeoR/GlpR family transcriptional regulator of sugar metabolism
MTKGMAKRKEKIIELLAADRHISVPEISKNLGVSAVTIRNDLDDLAEQGMLVRTHGGATLTLPAALIRKQRLMVAEKNRIGKAAAAIVYDGDLIIVETGTTVAAFVKHLLGKRDVRVVTNSMLILPYVRMNPGLHLTLLGGEFRPTTETCGGFITLAQLASFHVSRFFMGTDGFSLEDGMLYADAVDQVEIVKTMSQHADTTILLADSSKYGHKGFVPTLPLREVDLLITDMGLPNATVTQLEAAGIQVILS